MGRSRRAVRFVSAVRLNSLLCRFCLIAIGLAGTVRFATASTSFTEVSEMAGVQYLQHESQEPGDCVFGIVCDLDRMTGGAAAADVDHDGDTDLFVTRLDAPDLLFANQGDGKFADATAGSGLENFDLQSNAAAFADIDNDGDPDLVVTVTGAGVGTDENRMGSTFGDVDGDGNLDWFVTSIYDPDDTCAVENCAWAAGAGAQHSSTWTTTAISISS